MTFLELCQALRREAGISGTGPASVSGQTGEMGRVVEWIRAANTEIQNIPVNWDFLWDEYALVLTESVPGVFDQEYRLSDLGIKTVDRATFYAYPASAPLDRWQLRPVSYHSWIRTAGTVVATGRPTSLVLKPNGILRIDPVPDQLYTITFNYFRLPQALVSNTDEPIIPANFHDIIWQKALMEYARYENAVEVYQGAMAAYTKLLEDMKRRHVMEATLHQRPLC